MIIAPFPWALYSKKLHDKIKTPRNVGRFKADEAEARLMRLAKGQAGSLDEGNWIVFYWLVDKDDGLIVDSKFQAFGQSALIGAADATCELVIGKNYDQAHRITADLIDQQLRDKSTIPAFPKETYPHLNLILEAISEASSQCTDLPLPDAYIAPPVPLDIGEVLEGGYPGWEELPLKKKLTLIEEVLDRDVRPYIALDAGGIEVLNLIEGRELIIMYKGSCTSCYSSVGTTLSYIQQVLRNKVHPTLKVTPEV